MKGKHCIYLHRKPDGEVFYVGQTNAKGRPYVKTNRSKRWKKLVSICGSYTVEIRHQGLSKDEANNLEVFYIKLFGKLRDGSGTLVNMTDGAEGGVNQTYPDDVRKRMSESHKGEKNIMFGKTHSDEAKAKISKVQKGRIVTQEQREYLRKCNTGRIKTTEEIEKIRQSKLGKKRPEWVCKVLSDKAPKTPVIAIKDIAIYDFSSMKEASETIGRDRASIHRAAIKGGLCNGFRIYL